MARKKERGKERKREREEEYISTAYNKNKVTANEKKPIFVLCTQITIRCMRPCAVALKKTTKNEQKFLIDYLPFIGYCACEM